MPYITLLALFFRGFVLCFFVPLLSDRCSVFIFWDFQFRPEVLKLTTLKSRSLDDGFLRSNLASMSPLTRPVLIS